MVQIGGSSIIRCCRHTIYPKQAIKHWGGKPPVRYAPGKMVSGGIYQNFDGLLPSAPGRVWYEADLNYYRGKRNTHRILWSNDGLVFVTYDHYLTFIEVR